MFRNTFVPLLFSGIVLMLSGCGGGQVDYGSVTLLPVSGTVTLDGEPLEGATVKFKDNENFTFSFAYTDAQGYYELQFDSVMMGVTPGDKTVSITTTGPITEGGEEEVGEMETGSKKKEQLPKRYNKDSELKVNVSSEKLVYDFELASK